MLATEVERAKRRNMKEIPFNRFCSIIKCERDCNKCKAMEPALQYSRICVNLWQLKKAMHDAGMTTMEAMANMVKNIKNIQITERKTR